VFNHQNYGGYLLWRRRQPVFWDGRNDVFASLVREVTTIPFPAIVAHYGVEALLITEHEAPDLAPEIPERWGLVYWDDDSAVYLKRDGRYGALLGRLELRLFPGFGGRPGLEILARDPRTAEAARVELNRVLAAHPETQRALYFLGMISLYQGDLPRAESELSAALALHPNEQVEKMLATVQEIAHRAR
jgi:tetratricopeptide (TPR) repeat protein